MGERGFVPPWTTMITENMAEVPGENRSMLTTPPRLGGSCPETRGKERSARKYFLSPRNRSTAKYLCVPRKSQTGGKRDVYT